MRTRHRLLGITTRDQYRLELLAISPCGCIRCLTSLLLISQISTSPTSLVRVLDLIGPMSLSTCTASGLSLPDITQLYFLSTTDIPTTPGWTPPASVFKYLAGLPAASSSLCGHDLACCTGQQGGIEEIPLNYDFLQADFAQSTLTQLTAAMAEPFRTSIEAPFAAAIPTDTGRSSLPVSQIDVQGFAMSVTQDHSTGQPQPTNPPHPDASPIYEKSTFAATDFQASAESGYTGGASKTEHQASDGNSHLTSTASGQGSFPSLLSLDSQTLASGGTMITVSGTPIFLPISGGEIIVDGQRSRLTAPSAVILVGSRTYSVAPAGTFFATPTGPLLTVPALSGETLAPGAVLTGGNGEEISLPTTGGTDIVLFNGSATTTEGLGWVILSAFGIPGTSKAAERTSASIVAGGYGNSTGNETVAVPFLGGAVRMTGGLKQCMWVFAVLIWDLARGFRL